VSKPTPTLVSGKGILLLTLPACNAERVSFWKAGFISDPCFGCLTVLKHITGQRIVPSCMARVKVCRIHNVQNVAVPVKNVAVLEGE
jgi:hypothetical protein